MTASDGAGPDREALPWVCDLHGDRYGSDGCPSCDRNRQALADLVDSARHCDRCHRPLPLTDAERAACPPADGVEVREEWGVRWEADHHGVMRSSESWFGTEAQRKSFCTYFHPEIDPRGGRVLAFATRTATYATTRWEPQP